MTKTTRGGASSAARPSHPADVHKCDTCGRVFSERGNLRRHQKTHTGLKPFACTHKLPDGTRCPLFFAERANLNRHIMRRHTHKKPFKCDFCTKGFADKDSLVVHTRFHTGEKPFDCVYCGKRFARKFHMKRHEKTIHKEALALGLPPPPPHLRFQMRRRGAASAAAARAAAAATVPAGGFAMPPPFANAAQFVHAQMAAEAHAAAAAAAAARMYSAGAGAQGGGSSSHTNFTAQNPGGAYPIGSSNPPTEAPFKAHADTVFPQCGGESSQQDASSAQQRKMYPLSSVLSGALGVSEENGHVQQREGAVDDQNSGANNANAAYQPPKLRPRLGRQPLAPIINSPSSRASNASASSRNATKAPSPHVGNDGRTPPFDAHVAQAAALSPGSLSQHHAYMSAAAGTAAVTHSMAYSMPPPFPAGVMHYLAHGHAGGAHMPPPIGGVAGPVAPTQQPQHNAIISPLEGNQHPAADTSSPRSRESDSGSESGSESESDGEDDDDEGSDVSSEEDDPKHTPSPQRSVVHLVGKVDDRNRRKLKDEATTAPDALSTALSHAVSDQRMLHRDNSLPYEKPLTRSQRRRISLGVTAADTNTAIKTERRDSDLGIGGFGGGVGGLSSNMYHGGGAGGLSSSMYHGGGGGRGKGKGKLVGMAGGIGARRPPKLLPDIGSLDMGTASPAVSSPVSSHDGSSPVASEQASRVKGDDVASLSTRFGRFPAPTQGSGGGSATNGISGIPNAVSALRATDAHTALPSPRTALRDFSESVKMASGGARASNVRSMVTSSPLRLDPRKRKAVDTTPPPQSEVRDAKRLRSPLPPLDIIRPPPSSPIISDTSRALMRSSKPPPTHGDQAATAGGSSQHQEVKLEFAKMANPDHRRSNSMDSPLRSHGSYANNSNANAMLPPGSSPFRPFRASDDGKPGGGVDSTPCGKLRTAAMAMNMLSPGPRRTPARLALTPFGASSRSFAMSSAPRSFADGGVGSGLTPYFNRRADNTPVAAPKPHHMSGVDAAEGAGDIDVGALGSFDSPSSRAKRVVTQTTPTSVSATRRSLFGSEAGDFFRP